ncbi:MAG TPA: hypothetical protein VGD91_06845, partial [Trebonia sp.]
MSYDLESNEETHREGPRVAMAENDIGEISMESPAAGMDETYPAVSVIITTYSRDRWAWLRECIESAQAQT